MTATQAAYQRRIDRVMDHVRRNPGGDHSVKSLAGVACFSPYHFHRIFRARTGETVAHFVRRARLERAAYLMKAASTRTLGSIALDAGFASQSDFSRVFRSTYGIPPSAWDRRSVLREREPAIDSAPGAGGGVGPGRYGRPEPPVEARVVEHPAVRIAYLRVRDPWRGERLRHGFATVTRLLDERGVDWRGRPMFGVSWDHYDATPLDQVRFDLGFAVPVDLEPARPLGIHELPAMRAVDARSDGPLLRIARTWDHLYLEWLPRSVYEPAELPALTRFRRRPDQTGWDHWDVDCSIAIRPLRP